MIYRRGLSRRGRRREKDGPTAGNRRREEEVGHRGGPTPRGMKESGARECESCAVYRGQLRVGFNRSPSNCRPITLSLEGKYARWTKYPRQGEGKKNSCPRKSSACKYRLREPPPPPPCRGLASRYLALSNLLRCY